MKGKLSEHSRELLSRIDRQVRDQIPVWFAGAGAIHAAPRRGPVEIDYWSISYRLAFDKHSVFVKIPKMERGDGDIASIVRDPRALASARTEYESFTIIREIANWPAGCSTVRPLAYLPGFNAILTEFSSSADLFRLCRVQVTRALSLNPDAEHIRESLARCGSWLHHFQHAGVPSASIRVDSGQLLEDIFRWATEIESECLNRNPLRAMLNSLAQESWSFEMPRLRTCEGFEVRNILVDDDGVVRLVDPGQIAWSSGLEDVAHFLVSLTMLYWGTPVLWIGIPLSSALRRSFLTGLTQSGAAINPAILAWFEIRELFRQWLEACKVIDNKPYNRAIRKFLRFAYVDAFFYPRIRHCIRNVCGRAPERAGTFTGERI